MNETTRRVDIASTLAGRIPEKSSLHHLEPSEAYEEIIKTMVEHQNYCQTHDLKFLAYLIEMVILECMEGQQRLDENQASNERTLS